MISKQDLSVGGALTNKIGSVTVYFQSFQLVFMIFGDINARSKGWWSLHKQNRKRDSLFSIRSTRGYTQLINSMTHFIRNRSSCIDLIFTQQPNQVTSCGVHASLHNNQPVITTRIYVLHKITIALKFMSYINSDLQIPAKKLQTPG